MNARTAEEFALVLCKFKPKNTYPAWRGEMRTGPMSWIRSQLPLAHAGRSKVFLSNYFLSNF